MNDADDYHNMYNQLPESIRLDFCKLIRVKYGEKNSYTLTKGMESALESWFLSQADEASNELKKYVESRYPTSVNPEKNYNINKTEFLNLLIKSLNLAVKFLMSLFRSGTN